MLTCKNIFFIKYIVITILLLVSIHLKDGEIYNQNNHKNIQKRWIRNQNSQIPPKTTNEISDKIASSGTFIFSFKYEKIDRYYTVFVPTRYKSEKKLPLVLAFHGGGSDMNKFSDDEKYKLISQAEKEGFIIAFPNGHSQYKSGMKAYWNAGKCCYSDEQQKKINDIGFVKEMLGYLFQQVNFNKKRIFALGMSNGGMMSFRLACEMSDVFKAIAVVAGSDMTESCHPIQPVSILQIHAKNDQIVLFEGGSNQLEKNEIINTKFTAVQKSIEKWVHLNHCEKSSTAILKNDEVNCELYSGCNSNAYVKLCTTTNGGHSWPGSRKHHDTSEFNSTSIDANDVIWDFFKLAL